MRSPLKTLALSALAVLALGGAAQAADVTVTVRGDSYVRVSDHRGFEGGYGRGFEERRYGHGRGYDDDGFRSFPERRWNRVVETRGGWDHGRGDHGRWGHGGFGRGDCRVIIRRRVNPWGDVVVKKTRICD